MAYSTRGEIKRSLGVALKNIREANDRVVKIGSQYEVEHPDIYNQFAAIVSGVQLWCEALEKLTDRI